MPLDFKPKSMKYYIKIIIFLFITLSVSSCGFIHYMGTKERVEKGDDEIKTYLDKENFRTYNYSLKMKPYFLDKLAEKEHALDLYKLERNTEQSTMQIRVFDSNGELITGYTQCYGNLNWINILRKKCFVKRDKFYNNYELKFEDEFDLYEITEEEKNKILKESEGKNRIVIYWNIWSNYYSRIMLKKTRKYIKKFDPEMKNTFVILVNNDMENIREKDRNKKLTNAHNSK